VSRRAALAVFGLALSSGLTRANAAFSADPAGSASAMPGALPAVTGAASAAPAETATPNPTCTERIPAGKVRPKLTESLPDRGTSGHLLTLTLTLEHGKGETVLPGGFAPQAGSPEWRDLEKAGLFLPDTSGPSGPKIERTETGDNAKTTVRIGFVPLPEKPGRNRIELPPLPISVARASGDVLVLCTSPHSVTVEDPIANTSNPTPKKNPPPRPQLEEWTFLKNALLVLMIALVVGVLASFLITYLRNRPRAVPPPPPPRPPWEVALEELYDVRHAGLVAEGRFAEHFDRVSDTVRKYLGARYGFDGLESTTREALFVLRRVTPRITVLDTIESFLQKADLVKFARLTPGGEDCELALNRAETLVRETLPSMPTYDAVPAQSGPKDESTTPAPQAGGSE
jgi:hypothetical protein